MKIVLDLEDDEFLELGGLGFAVDCWPAKAKKHAFGRLLLKIKDKVEQRATPGQLRYLDKVVVAIRQAAVDHEVGVMMTEDGFKEIADAAGMNLRDPNGLGGLVSILGNEV